MSYFRDLMMASGEAVPKWMITFADTYGIDVENIKTAYDIDKNIKGVCIGDGAYNVSAFQVDTGLAYNTTDILEVSAKKSKDVALLQSATSWAVVANNTTEFCLYYQPSAIRLRGRCASTKDISITDAYHKFKVTSNTFYVDGIVYASGTWTLPITRNIYIGLDPNLAKGGFSGIIGLYKRYTSSNVLRQLLCPMNSNGVAGMYDLKNNYFIESLQTTATAEYVEL